MRIIKEFRKLSETSIMAAALIKAGKVKDEVRLIKEKVVDLAPKYLASKAPTKKTRDQNTIPSERAEKGSRIPVKARVYLGMTKALNACQRAAQELSEASQFLWDNIKLSNKIIGARGRKFLVSLARFKELRIKYLSL